MSAPTLRVIAALAVISLAGFTTRSAAVSATTPATDAAADRDWQAIGTFRTGIQPKMADATTNRAKYERADGLSREMLGLLETFYAAHPADPRRWRAVLMMRGYTPFFITAYGPDIETKGLAAATFDEPARAAVAARLTAYETALAQAGDVPPDVRESADRGAISRALADVSAGKNTDWPSVRAQLDAFCARYPDSKIVGGLLQAYFTEFEAGHTQDETVTELTRYRDHPNATVRERVAGKLHSLELMQAPLAMVFTAVDGREVDLQNMRGKVVLVDFWATWCGPCKEEIPNVKKVYAAYHARGFEVVGIALENGKLAPHDTPGETEAKLTAAKKILTDFTAQNDMPWPQYFDGKWWKNDIATKYTVNAIPAMFLLDQDGKVVSTNARGEKLEAEVQRLLKR